MSYNPLRALVFFLDKHAFQLMTSTVIHDHAFKNVGMRIVKGRPIQYIRCQQCGLLLCKR